MIITDLYDFLTSKEFKVPDTGNLFFPAFMYTYPADKEYETRKMVLEFKDRMKRPNNYLDSLVLNIYDEFIDFLKSQTFVGESLLDLVFDKEETEGTEELGNYLKSKVNTDEFYDFVAQKVSLHFTEPENLRKVYVLMYGFGSIFPYLRTSVFLNNFQKYIKNYKLIIFYPGEYRNGSYYLFGKLDDKHLYRASRLNDF